MTESSCFKFRLYVAGEAHNSTQAIANLKAFCLEHLADRHEIEIVDVLREPNRALAESVWLTPMLIKWWPEPICKVVGNLSEPQPLLDLIE